MTTSAAFATSQVGQLHLHSRADFVRRVALFVAVGVGFIGLSLGFGVLGYRLTAGDGWTDALLNASMILAGMGQVDPLPHGGAKIFASLSALYGGAVYPTTTAIVIYPFLHRLLSVMHLSALATAAQAAEAP